VSVVIAGPSTLAVQWACRRCGTSRIARTTIPVGPDWTEPMIRYLLDLLKLKLQRTHPASGCLATLEDFTVQAYVPPDTRMLDRL
jgi:hypothetical protein